MRVRHKPYAGPELAAWEHHINQPEQHKGLWPYLYANPANPMHIELGCGKGGFLGGLALRETGINYLGVDIKNEMLVVAKRTIEALFQQRQQPPANILITNYNIERISNLLAPQDNVKRIYINFCNPWYKSGHAKHRLTHPRQLVAYRDFLAETGEIYFKTDDDLLFEKTLEYLSYSGYAVEWLTRNLHADEPDWNIRTEHEQMFSREGIPIKACIARKQPAHFDREIIRKLKDI